MASSIFSLPGAVLVTAMEVLLVARWSTDHEIGLRWVALAVFAINCGIVLLYTTMIHPDFISPLRNIVGPKWSLPRMTLHRLASSSTQGELLLEMVRETPNDGLVALREFTRRRLLVTKPHVLADLLVHRSQDFEKPENMRRFLRNLLGDGLLMVEGERHKFLRKSTNPAFTFRRVRDLYPMMWKNSLAFCEVLEADLRAQNPGAADAPEGSAEITHWANKTTLNIIGNSLLGRDLNVFGDGEDKLVKSYEVVFDPSKEMLLYFILSAWISHRLANTLPWRMGRVFRETTATLKDICVQLARDRREEVKNGGGGHVDILTQLIRMDVFSDDELADQLLTFLAAGHDTTALTFTWACFLLALDPARQSALRKEVRDNLSACTREPRAAVSSADELAATMERLPLLNGVISETLRLYPTVPVSIRTAVRDTALAGQPIPRDTEILLSPWVINRSRELWGADADAFRPERWISISPGGRGGGGGGGGKGYYVEGGQMTGEGPEHGKPNYTGGASSNYDFMTFLHGPRSCIGQNFARAELRCLLAAMASRFEWTLDMAVEDVVPGGAITIKPQNGLHLRLKAVGEAGSE